MDLIAAFDPAKFASTALSWVWVALGLGLVIFFHELGHFAVAKWCGVFVERFSIGFGPILWSFKRGETEYALSAVPFGGYVKMLGQDDMEIFSKSAASIGGPVLLMGPLIPTMTSIDRPVSFTVWVLCITPGAPCPI